MEIHTENIDVQNPSNTGAKIKDGNNKAEKKLAERIALTAHKEAEAVVYRDVEYFKMTHPEAEIEEAAEFAEGYRNFEFNSFNALREKDKYLSELKNANTAESEGAAEKAVPAVLKKGEEKILDACDPVNYGSIFDENGEMIGAYDPSGWTSVPQSGEKAEEYKADFKNYGAYVKVRDEINREDLINICKNILSSKT